MADAPQDIGQAIKVLLVDDEADFLEMLGKRLGLRGLSVHSAASGPCALEILEQEEIDVVVLDVWMPEMNGIVTLKHIRNRWPQVQVILLTGHADLEASLEGMALGAFDYLTKPVNIDRLITKIQQAAHAVQEPPLPEQQNTFSTKMEKSLKAADRLASLGTLAAGVAHEINNPLAIISEASGWMKTRLAKEQTLPEQSLANLMMALDKIATSVERARRISQRLLGFARKTEAAEQDSDLGFLAEEVVELVGKTAAQADAEISISMETSHRLIRVDTYQLRQVLLNLCTNALHAVEPGGKVRIVISGDEKQAMISVIDNGKGIPPENLERIFEPFFTTKPPDQGTGLGLSVSRGIAEKLGGRIEVESQPGQGATFRLILPRHLDHSLPQNKTQA